MTEIEPFKIGIVKSIDRVKCTAKVHFEDLDNVLSFDLQVVTKNTMNKKRYWMPCEGESVLCAFLDNGAETGFILGTIYSDKDTPPEEATDGTNKDGIWFPDGTTINYCSDTATLKVDTPGTLNLKVSGDINIVGNVNLKGNLRVSGSISNT